ncbi:hypothetical protein Nepgr_027220 [Nepenthes gracilis]|uniref:Uncharacterized protein n=1 Tax=Nepenthes gracilis TaxID=150966 RepID=A0AAD3Y123_NEPGR|nr:hypothetical protein Nepgr_027220 [Nepenthes gracilis]
MLLPSMQCAAVYRGASSGSQMLMLIQLDMLLVFDESGYLETCICWCILCWVVKSGVEPYLLFPHVVDGAHSNSTLLKVVAAETVQRAGRCCGVLAIGCDCT